jgi:hypothetical protein
VYKTDLNVATLEDWKLKVLTFMRRRYPSRFEDPEFFYDSDARFEDQ